MGKKSSFFFKSWFHSLIFSELNLNSSFYKRQQEYQSHRWNTRSHTRTVANPPEDPHGVADKHLSTQTGLDDRHTSEPRGRDARTEHLALREVSREHTVGLQSARPEASPLHRGTHTAAANAAQGETARIPETEHWQPLGTAPSPLLRPESQER